MFRGSEIYPPVSPYDMMNQIGASAPPADPFDVGGGTASAPFMSGGDPVVAGYNKSEGVVNLSYFISFVLVLFF